MSRKKPKYTKFANLSGVYVLMFNIDTYADIRNSPLVGLAVSLTPLLPWGGRRLSQTSHRFVYIYIYIHILLYTCVYIYLYILLIL